MPVSNFRNRQPEAEEGMGLDEDTLRQSAQDRTDWMTGGRHGQGGPQGELSGRSEFRDKCSV
jgi:hypothetical protein